MRVLVTGARGMLGSVLVADLQGNHDVTGVDTQDFDITCQAGVEKVCHELRPEFVFHLAAYTDVDGCEKDSARAHEVNSLGTRNVAEACAEIGATLLYVSTDYVFSGRKKGPYREDDCPDPQSAYGLSKLRGEQYVQAGVAKHFIVRTSWLYGPYGKNFVATILKLAKERGELRVVSDQRGSPTYTRHLAGMLVRFLGTSSYGVFHATGSGDCSWFEFAQTIVRAAGWPQVRVKPISSGELARPARRPENSVLENRRLTECNLGALPRWEQGLDEYLRETEEPRDFATPGIRYAERFV